MKNVTGSNIKRLREARGLTQEALARELGYTRASVSAWEHGVNAPLSKLEAMANFFSVPVEELTFGNLDHELNEGVVEYQVRTGDPREEVRFLREVVKTLLKKLPPADDNNP